MEKFAFIIHPLDIKDVSKKIPLVNKLPDRFVERLLPIIPPFNAAHVTGIRSALAEAEGWFIAVPLTSLQMMTLPQEYVLDKIIQAGKIAEKLGAKILGLGAFSSIVGDAGITIAKHLSIPVTTGNSYTVYTAVEGVKKAAGAMGINISEAEVVVIGATGSIGSICAQLLASDVKQLTLVGRDLHTLRLLANRIMFNTGLAVRTSNNVKKSLKQADVVLTVTSALDTIVEPEDLKPGAVVCDVSRPRNVSKQVAEQRNDVLVIEGGLVEAPGAVEYNMKFGAPEGQCFACMAETMILALEQRYESYTLGRELSIEQVENIGKLGQKHGFGLSGFRSFSQHLSESDIRNIRERVRASAALV